MFPLWAWQLVIASLTAAGLMTAVWLLQLRTKNAGIVDVTWAGSIGLIGVGLAITSPGDFSRRMLLAALIGLWSLRLSGYLYLRVVGHPEEGRYATLRQQWGAEANSRLFRFFQVQAATVVLFATPVLIGAYSTRPLFGAWDLLGLAVWLVGVFGVAVADWQLARFKRTSSSRGRTCRDGLWRYSRHPNYFFEWLHWWSYVLLATGNLWWWVAAITPILLLYFLVFVTGIPPTEAQAVASRGDDYREYQRTTSAFVPWFPRPEKAK